MGRETLACPALLLIVLCTAEPAFGSGCTITSNAPTVTATDIAFPPYSASAVSPDGANGSVKIRCPLGVGLLPSFDIALSAGSAGGFSPRQMAQGSNRLGYNIYTAGDYSTVWGDGNGGSVTQSFSAILSLGTITFTAYGLIPTGQYLRGGTYNDTITVTVTY
jgi:spore coat protein U-like protein